MHKPTAQQNQRQCSQYRASRETGRQVALSSRFVVPSPDANPNSIQPANNLPPHLIPFVDALAELLVSDYLNHTAPRLHNKDTDGKR